MSNDREKIANILMAWIPGQKDARLSEPDRYRAADAVLKIVDDRENDLILRWKSAEDALGRVYANEQRVLTGLRALDHDLDDGKASGVIYTYGQVQSRLRALLTPTEAPIDPFWEREHP